MNRRKIKNRNNKINKKLGAYRSATTRFVSTIQNPVFGFIEPRCLTNMRYNTVVPFTAVGAAAGSSFGFKINSCFDPELPIGGHQPYGFDTLANIYSHYRVLRVHWNIEAGPSSDRMMVGVIVSSQPPTAVTNLATYSLAAESPLSWSKSLSFSGGTPARFDGSIAINELLGLTVSQMNSDDTYAAPVTADPPQLAYLTVYCYNPTAGAVSTSCNVNLQLDTVFYDPYLQNQS